MVKFGAVMIKGVGHMAKWVTGIKIINWGIVLFIWSNCICGSPR